MIKPPEFTTERFYLEHSLKHGIPALHRHINRYKWAASRVPAGARVLDIGCGSGYGDFILITKAASVFGIDRDSTAIEYATRKAKERVEKRISYGVLDASEPVGEDVKKFGAVVCIEMIEHVNAEAQAALLKNAVTMLEPGGVFILTTPEKGTETMTWHHVRELSRSELDSMLAPYFDHIEYDDPIKYGIPDNFILAVCRKAGVPS